MSDTFTYYYDSPVGKLKLTSTSHAITAILFWRDPLSDVEPSLELPTVIFKCIEELTAYFNGSLRNFNVPVEQEGTGFQQRVWNELTLIPFGKTISYLELAKRLGDAKAIRAAASTNGKNKLSIIVPCHRVIGSNQSLVGYAGGLSNKKWLLEHEAKIAHGVQTLF